MTILILFVFCESKDLVTFSNTLIKPLFKVEEEWYRSKQMCVDGVLSWGQRGDELESWEGG